MSITAEQAAKLLEGTTPGPWEKMLGTHGRNKICATYPCINGLSALFTIADVNVPEESERGYTDDAFNPDVAAANTGLIAAAPDLARALIVSEAARKLAEERLAKAVEALQSIVDSYEATSELHTSSAECAANLYDFARVALMEIGNG